MSMLVILFLRDLESLRVVSSDCDINEINKIYSTLNFIKKSLYYTGFSNRGFKVCYHLINFKIVVF